MVCMNERVLDILQLILSLVNSSFPHGRGMDVKTNKLESSPLQSYNKVYSFIYSLSNMQDTLDHVCNWSGNNGTILWSSVR